MELSVDALKILASKLDASTLEALRGSSKSIRTDLDFALSDNLTYKLPDLRTSWKKVYESFSEESIMISVLSTREESAWKALPLYKRRLFNALFSFNPVVVEIAILLGIEPSFSSNKALDNALVQGNSQVAEVLLNDDSVSIW